MTIMADAPVARPPLPVRPAPHERDGRQPVPAGGRPHPQGAAHTTLADGEALRRVVADEIGPRRPGAIYQTVDGGRFEVLKVVTVAAEAKQLLRRESARWAVIVRDALRPDGQPVVVGSAWATSDHLIRETARKGAV
ncbi:hypothetical protein [Streptomyces sp. NPDC087294]|uniref:hypothetical protein n=1 Tax=Streptomyces sp. NPDC087294 TaxID=3365777 RepID=UPI0037FEF7D4